jgi:hypothetical protein
VLGPGARGAGMAGCCADRAEQGGAMYGVRVGMTAGRCFGMADRAQRQGRAAMRRSSGWRYFLFFFVLDGGLLSNRNMVGAVVEWSKMHRRERQMPPTF